MTSIITRDPAVKVISQIRAGIIKRKVFSGCMKIIFDRHPDGLQKNGKISVKNPLFKIILQVISLVSNDPKKKKKR